MANIQLFTMCQLSRVQWTNVSNVYFLRNTFVEKSFNHRNTSIMKICISRFNMSNTFYNL
jgi:hypothetical protein